MRGLIVREPWASMIVRGEKTWEIRRTRTKIRGRILIISSGFAIGSVELVDVIGPLSVEELSRFEEYHRVNREMLEEYAKGKELYAWVFANPVKFEEKKRIQIPRGAQMWVRVE